MGFLMSPQLKENTHTHTYFFFYDTNSEDYLSHRGWDASGIMFNMCCLSHDWLVMKKHFESGEWVKAELFQSLSSPFLSDKREDISCHWNMVCRSRFGKSHLPFLAVAICWMALGILQFFLQFERDNIYFTGYGVWMLFAKLCGI